MHLVHRALFIFISFLSIGIGNLTVASVDSTNATREFFVGELREQWDFPSDHLPIGICVNDLHFACWNILNTAYLHHIENNSQGLKDSNIISKNYHRNQDSALTVREEIVMDLVLELLHHPTCPRSVLGLEETGDIFWEELKKHIPENFQAITTFPNDLAHGDVFLYDTEIFEYVDLYSANYQCHPVNTIMSLTLKHKTSNQLYRFIQSHVPGGPVKSAPARQELANFVMDFYDPNMVLVIMGDMNRSPDYFEVNFQEAAESLNREQPYKTAYIPYPTHINTHMKASWIDNIFYSAPDHFNVQVSCDESFFPAVNDTVSLMYNHSFIPK